MSGAAKDERTSFVRSILEDMANQVMATSHGGIDWHIELPESRVYDVAALLVFTRTNDPDTELVVATVTLRAGGDAEWALDVVGRDSRWLGETRIPRGSRGWNDGDPNEIAGAAEFFQQLVPAVVAELGDR